PNAARIYDAWLGGKDNFRADRRAADEVAQAAPFVVESARTNRAFLRRAVMHPPSTLHLPQGWPWQPAWNGLHTAESVRERIFTRKR
ncbi:MAG: SAM-dependent methyltransferase, partial [Kineosporiaceae bacterium]